MFSFLSTVFLFCFVFFPYAKPANGLCLMKKQIKFPLSIRVAVMHVLGFAQVEKHM